MQESRIARTPRKPLRDISMSRTCSWTVDSNTVMARSDGQPGLTDVHDLILRKIAKWLRCDNYGLYNLMVVCKRFYEIRYIFMKYMLLNPVQSQYAIAHRPKYWETINEMAVYNIEQKDLHLLSNKKDITITNSKCTDFSVLKNIEYLEINNSNVSLISFTGVRTLILFDFMFLRDLSTLSNIEDLTLHYCHNVEDITPLANIRTLNLIYCRLIINVAPLANVHKLYLRSCNGILDVSPLCKVYDLTLDTCVGIEDVSALGGVHNLKITRCPVNDFSALGTVYNLYIESLTLDDVSALGSVHTLTLDSCGNVDDVSPLSQVQKLTLSSCNNIRDISALRSVPKLNIIDCPNIRAIMMVI